MVEMGVYTFSIKRGPGGWMFNALFVINDNEWMLSKDEYGDYKNISLPRIQILTDTTLTFPKIKEPIDMTNRVAYLSKPSGRVIWKELVKNNFIALDRLAKDSIMSKHFMNGTETIKKELL